MTETPPAEGEVQKPDKGPKCPHCKEWTEPEHDGDNEHKDEAFHCNYCGGCWLPDLSGIRPGHPQPNGWHEADELPEGS